MPRQVVMTIPQGWCKVCPLCFWPLLLLFFLHYYIPIIILSLSIETNNIFSVRI